MVEACVGYDTVVFFTFFLEFLDESFTTFYVKVSKIKCTKNGTPFSKFTKFPENFQKT